MIILVVLLSLVVVVVIVGVVVVVVVVMPDVWGEDEPDQDLEREEGVDGDLDDARRVRPL